MTDQDLTPQELRLLLAVAQSGSFTGAADLLGLTQSAVSHSIRACERKVGAVLFDRGRMGAAATPAGRRVVVHARHILRQLEILRAEARGAATGSLGGALRIATFRSAAACLLPPALERLAARLPGLTPQVIIVPELGRGTAGEVADGRADLAIANLAEDAELPDGLVAEELMREPYLFVHPTGHPDPRSLPLIDWPENCSSYTRTWWSRQDWLPSAHLQVPDDGVVLSMVAQGLGMAILPRLTLSTAPQQVTVASLGDQPPTRRIVSVTRRATRYSLAVRELAGHLRLVGQRMQQAAPGPAA